MNYKEWDERYGKIYRSLIKEEVPSIMIGHISFPAYQKEQINGIYPPATLSKEIITDLLKGELNFKGVVVSDAVNMGGFSGYYDNELEASIKCFEAGADILLWPPIAIIDSIEARIKRKEIPMSRLNDAVSRVWQMKENAGLFSKTHQLIKPLKDQTLAKHQNSANTIASNSLTLLSDTYSQLPLNPEKTKKLLVVIVSEDDERSLFKSFTDNLTNKGFDVDVKQNFSFFEHGGQIEDIGNTYDQILFVYHGMPANPWGSLSLRGKQALSVWSANYLPAKKVISIGIGDPYKNLIYMYRTGCRINIYNNDPGSCKALTEALLTKNYKFVGNTPVKK